VCCLGGCEGVECWDARVDVFMIKIINIFKIEINIESLSDGGNSISTTVKQYRSEMGSPIHLLPRS
jgi:hypothetical protein